MGVEMPALVDATDSIATWRRVLPKGSDPVDLYVMISMDHSSTVRVRLFLLARVRLFHVRLFHLCICR